MTIVTISGPVASYLITGGGSSVGLAVLVTAFLLALPIFLQDDLRDPARVGHLVRSHDDLLASYDFIVIDGGSAGCAIAARLSEDPYVSVLLIEAGGLGNAASNVPFTTAAVLDESLSWSYKTRPDGRSCLGMSGQSCTWHRGRAIGGSSVINGMLHVRGNPRDYNEWSQRGNLGWSFQDVLPFFRKGEDQRDAGLAANGAFHSRGGPQPVSFPRFRSKVAHAFLEAGASLGYSVQKDLNSFEQFGFSFMQVNMKEGSRYSSARSFLGGIERPNLHIAVDAHIEEIKLKNTRAIGVIFQDNRNIRRLIKTDREVILSAGAIASPQILMLSGIGRKQDLEPFGIKVVRSLPVGYGLQSHVGTGELIFSVEKTGLAFNTMAILNPNTYLSYARNREGPLTSANQFEGLAFLRTGLSNMSWPDVELQLVASHVAADGGLAVRNHLGISRKLFNGINDEMAFKEGFTIIPYLLHPYSRGRIKLQSRNPRAPPIIEPNYFNHPKDVATMINAIRKTLKLVNKGPTFKRHGAKLIRRKNPFCLRFKWNSDAYWECVLRHNTQTVYHDVGSCSMGVDSRTSVVSPELRVWGIDGLRVADASVFPTHTSGNTNTPVVMVAERAADLIKRDWNIYKTKSATRP